MAYSMVKLPGKIDMKLKKLTITITHKRLIVIVSLLSFLLSGCSNLNKTFENNTIKVSQNGLVISTFSNKNKANILYLNVNNENKEHLIKDKNIAVTGDLSNDGSKIVYADALNDNDPWQIYLHDLVSNKTCRLTDNKFGKSQPKFANNDCAYFLTYSKEKQAKIEKVNIKKKSHDILDTNDKDMELDAFNIGNNKLIMSTDSSSLRLKKWNENNGKDQSITHNIFETDLNGKNLRKIYEIQASLVQSISYGYKQNEIIVSGCDINGNSGFGIYEISLDTGKLNVILTDDMLEHMKSSAATKIAHPSLAVISKNKKLIYFTGVHRNSKSTNIGGISCYPTDVFSYNMNSKKIKDVFKPTLPSLVFDLNIKYLK